MPISELRPRFGLANSVLLAFLPCSRIAGPSAADPDEPMQRKLSPLERQAADALRRARRLPVGPSRNDLRQLATGLLWLHRSGMQALEQERAKAISVPDQVEKVIA
jgi:hypothetical protein